MALAELHWCKRPCNQNYEQKFPWIWDAAQIKSQSNRFPDLVSNNEGRGLQRSSHHLMRVPGYRVNLTMWWLKSLYISNGSIANLPCRTPSSGACTSWKRYLGFKVRPRCSKTHLERIAEPPQQASTWSQTLLHYIRVMFLVIKMQNFYLEL